NATDNFPVITETNLMYSPHTYEPYNYTTQLQAWAGTGDGGKYPDETILVTPPDITYTTGQYNNPNIPKGTTGWTYYQGVPYTINDDTNIVAMPVFNGGLLGSGKVYFDDITINEVDSKGNVLQQIFSYNITSDSNFYYWSQNNNGAMATATVGRTDNASLSITGSSGYASVTDDNHQFKIQKGKIYTISGWMKGDTIPNGATAYIGFGLYYSPSGTPAYARDYNYLKAKAIQYSQYPVSMDYPVYFGEFGTVRPTFLNGKGGDLWVKDMLHIFDSLGFNWTYHDYNDYGDAGFGIYASTSSPIDTTLGTASLIADFENYFGVPLTVSVTAISSAVSQETDIKVFPNPSQTAFTVVTTETAAAQIT